MDRIYTPVIDVESGEVYIPDRHTVKTALSLARAAFIISNAYIFLYMAMIQYFLFRIRFSKSKTKAPTSTENFVAVVILWIVHRLFDISISTIIDATVQVLCNGQTTLHYRLLRYGPAFDIGYWVLVPVDLTWWSNIHLVFWEVFVTWFLYLTISTSLFFTPIMLEMRQNPRRVFRRLRQRSQELAVFMTMLFQEEDPIVRFISSPSFEWRNENITKKIGQSIQLQRNQDEFPGDGERTLNWDISIDNEALAEMMETLGPPGGFGELGFNVTAGKVCFGAMGVGTRFNLNFVLEDKTQEERAKDK